MRRKSQPGPCWPLWLPAHFPSPHHLISPSHMNSHHVRPSATVRHSHAGPHQKPSQSACPTWKSSPQSCKLSIRLFFTHYPATGILLGNGKETDTRILTMSPQLSCLTDNQVKEAGEGRLGAVQPDFAPHCQPSCTDSQAVPRQGK